MSEWIDGCTRQQRGGGSHHLMDIEEMQRELEARIF
jgi:hypothetical protein